MSRRPNGGTVAGVWQRDRGRCWVCTRKVAIADASRDHIRPRSSGGYDKSRNYRLAHKLCNEARGRLPEDVVAGIRAQVEGSSVDELRRRLRQERAR